MQLGSVVTEGEVGATMRKGEGAVKSNLRRG